MVQKQIPLSIHRLEAFSDGVIAIVITLMIFGIKVPTIADSASGSEIWKSLLTMGPSLVAYLLSFVMLGVLWVNHHQFFHQLKNIDRKLLWYNLHLLFWMCILPIPTSFLGSHFEWPEATALYGFTMFMNAFAFALLREYITKHDHLLRDNLSSPVRKKMRIKIWTSVLLYFISIFAGYISVYIPIGIFLLILIIYFLPQNVVIEHTEE